MLRLTVSKTKFEEGTIWWNIKQCVSDTLLTTLDDRQYMEDRFGFENSHGDSDTIPNEGCLDHDFEVTFYDFQYMDDKVKENRAALGIFREMRDHCMDSPLPGMFEDFPVGTYRIRKTRILDDKDAAADMFDPPPGADLQLQLEIFSEDAPWLGIYDPKLGPLLEDEEPIGEEETGLRVVEKRRKEGKVKQVNCWFC